MVRILSAVIKSCILGGRIQEVRLYHNFPKGKEGEFIKTRGRREFRYFVLPFAPKKSLTHTLLHSSQGTHCDISFHFVLM